MTATTFAQAANLLVNGVVGTPVMRPMPDYRETRQRPTASRAANRGQVKARKEAFFGRLMDRIIRSRQAAADRQVAFYLNTLDDATLRRVGYSDSEISGLRAGRVVRPSGRVDI